MKTIRFILPLAALCAVTGCETTGLSPRENSGVTYPNYILSLESGGPNSPSQKITMPIRLAVAQVGQAAPPKSMLDRLASEKSLVVNVNGLPLPGAAENTFGRNSAANPDEYYAERIKAVCNLARNSGANYIFVFGGNVDSWRKNNSLAIFDATIVGGVLLPGGRTEMEGRGAGALISVETGQPVFFVTADAKDSAASPDYLAEGRTAGMRAKVRDELIEKLTGELLDKLENQAGTF
jgi:hypothetical protein